MSRSEKHFFALLTILLLAFKLYIKNVGFGSLDGIWQLSSFWSFQRDVWFYNEYLSNHLANFNLISLLLSPILSLLGNNPVTVFYSGIYALNVLLLFKLIQPKERLEWIACIIIVLNPLFSQFRLDDLAISLLLIGFVVFKSKPKLEEFVYASWLIFVPLIHPVPGLIVLILVAFVLFFYQRNFTWIILLAFIPWTYLLMENYHIFFSELGNRTEAHYVFTLKRLIPNLLPFSAIFFIKRFDSKIKLFLLVLSLLVLIIGKPYYFASWMVVCLYFYYFRSEEVNWSLKQKAIGYFCLIISLIIFPLNQIIQWTDNPQRWKLERKIVKEVRELNNDGGLIFVSPELVEPILEKSNVRFSLFDEGRMIFLTDVSPGDVMLITKEKAVNYIKSQFPSCVINAQFATVKGDLLLSKGYHSRNEALNLWIVKF